MKRYIYVFAAIAALCNAASAADWEAIKRAPAKIEVVNMQATPLVVGDDKKGWAKVPDRLSKYGAVIYMPTGTTNGVADIKINEDGFLMIACNYDYQGNSSGKWDEEDWN